MSDSHPDLDARQRDASFNVVLEAEKASEDALKACRDEADQIRQKAAAAERRIASRTGERVRCLHNVNQRHIENTKISLRDAFEAERQTGAIEPDAGEIRAAASRLARRIAGLETP